MPAKGLKQQVFGGVLFSLGTMTALLSRIIGFDLDIFYVVIGIAGIGLYVYGFIQRRQAESASEGHCAESASIKQRVSIHGE